MPEEPTDRTPGPSDDAELDAAVDDALRAEVKRQIVQRIVGLNRAEGGVGRETYRDDDDPSA